VELILNETITAVVLFIVGVIAGMINVNAGGGSTLTLPALIFLGLDSATANGTNRLAIILQTISSSAAYSHSKYNQFRLSLKLALITLPGVLIGAIAAVKIDDDTFQIILGIVMLGIIITLLIPQTASNVFDDSSSKKITIPVFISFVLTGFYGGFIQVGIGFILMAILNKLMKFSLVYVNMHKAVIVMLYTIPALLVFVIAGNVNWYLGVVLGLGNAAGAWWATKTSIKKGDKFIKIFLIIAMLIISLKLIGIIP
jgi:uncharacterized membrane protein YfcA